MALSGPFGAAIIPIFLASIDYEFFLGFDSYISFTLVNIALLPLYTQNYILYLFYVHRIQSEKKQKWWKVALAIKSMALSVPILCGILQVRSSIQEAFVFIGALFGLQLTIILAITMRRMRHISR